MKMKKKRKTNLHSLLLTAHHSKGITLVALVVTIVVLLILAGITIVLLLGDNGIIAKAQKAKEETERTTAEEQEKFNTLVDRMDEALGVIKIPEGLEIGSKVTYSPSGTYNWLHKYCSSTKAEKAEDGTDAYDLLESGTGKDFNITSWRVLSINKTTGRVELIPSSLTQATGTVYLGEAQGYNNGVKLLNDACSALYGNTAKGITARSINIEDIEKYMTDTAVAEAHAYDGGNATYNEKTGTAYSQSNSYYPTMYAQEIKSVIDRTEKTSGLGLSEQNTFIERTDNSATAGKLQATTSIQPYQTHWYKDATYMQMAFKDSYYNLIMPSGKSTTYWVASRCISTDSDNCCFNVRNVYSGGVGACDMFYSNGNTYRYSLALFPVVTLSSNNLYEDAESRFSVK